MAISEEQLYISCRILFGPDIEASRQFLDYLQIGGIKSAYRRRVLETHPDRLCGVDCRSPRQGGEQFHAVQEAYETLLAHLRNRAVPTGRDLFQAREFQAAAWPQPPRVPQGPDPVFAARTVMDGNAWHPRRRIQPTVSYEDQARAASPAIDHYYQGPLPRRRLLFGHFLYYSGLANWRTIARVLVWQRAERPRIGELGRRFGMCREEDIKAILQAKQPCSRFGETAQMLGILSDQQVKRLIVHQQLMQKKFGMILMERKLIDQSDLDQLLGLFRRHNATLQAI